MITSRGDVTTITASIVFSKKDTQTEGWEAIKKRLLSTVIPTFEQQIAKVIAQASHEAEVKERIKANR